MFTIMISITIQAQQNICDCGWGIRDVLQKSGIDIAFPLFYLHNTLWNYWSQVWDCSARPAIILKKGFWLLRWHKTFLHSFESYKCKTRCWLLEIPRGPRGIDFVFLDPRGMLNCHSSIPRFPEEWNSPRNCHSYFLIDGQIFSFCPDQSEAEG